MIDKNNLTNVQYWNFFTQKKWIFVSLILVFLVCSGGQFCRRQLISWPKKEMENSESDLRIVTQEEYLRKLWELFHS